MAHRISRLSASLALAASLAMVASPAQARGWGSWGGGHHRHHRDNVDAGDIFAGLLVIGTIAAVASAASKSGEDRPEDDYRYADSDPREPSPGYGIDQGVSRRSSPGIDGAVDSCVDEMERAGSRVDTVDSVKRDGDGWRIAGRVGGDRDFDCSVSKTGRVHSVRVEGVSD